MDMADGGIPIGCLISCSSLHESQATIPLATMTQQRVPTIMISWIVRMTQRNITYTVENRSMSRSLIRIRAIEKQNISVNSRHSALPDLRHRSGHARGTFDGGASLWTLQERVWCAPCQGTWLLGGPVPSDVWRASACRGSTPTDDPVYRTTQHQKLEF